MFQASVRLGYICIWLCGAVPWAFALMNFKFFKQGYALNTSASDRVVWCHGLFLSGNSVFFRQGYALNTFAFDCVAQCLGLVL